MIFVLIPVVLVGYVALTATEKVTNKLVERKNLTKFVQQVQQDPFFHDNKNPVLVAGKPRVYRSEIQQMVAEGQLGYPAEVRLEAITEAESKAQELLTILPERKLLDIWA